ncbi:flagellar assembly protein H [Stutzerimonas urumqiensis]|uniref:flagellar assembly protein FliH n=1 Tax=Stutzerimonas urumqiensis TaxID=638269 RepID=UPI003BACCC56
MSVKVIKGAGREWRPFRFPPRFKVSGPSHDDWSGDPAALQRAVADGFQEGVERGYREGLEQGRQAGHGEGFERGVQDGKAIGREEGRAQGRQAFDEAARPLEQVVASFERFRRDFEQARRDELLELVQKVAKQVIRCELTLHPTQLLSLAEEALAAMPGDPQDVRILLNPEECARIKELAPERAAAWRLVPDDKLALGECRVITAESEADIGCQQRLDACMDALGEHIRAEA